MLTLNHVYTYVYCTCNPVLKLSSVTRNLFTQNCENSIFMIRNNYIFLFDHSRYDFWLHIQLSSTSNEIYMEKFMYYLFKYKRKIFTLQQGLLTCLIIIVIEYKVKRTLSFQWIEIQIWIWNKSFVLSFNWDHAIQA